MIFVEQVPLRHTTGRVTRRKRGLTARQPLDVGNAGVVAYRRCAFAAQLESVIASRVVAGGDHDAGIGRKAGDRVIESRGSHLADVDHVAATGHDGINESLSQTRAALPHVATDHDPFGTKNLDRSRANSRS